MHPVCKRWWGRKISFLGVKTAFLSEKKSAIRCLEKDLYSGGGMQNTAFLQWMTAGRGIVHSEMPYGDAPLHGLQLWVNLAKEFKMIEPQYQELKDKDIPKKKEDGIAVSVIAGSAFGIKVSCFTCLQLKQHCSLPPFGCHSHEDCSTTTLHHQTTALSSDSKRQTFSELDTKNLALFIFSFRKIRERTMIGFEANKTFSCHLPHPHKVAN